MRESLAFAVLTCACGVAVRTGPARGPAPRGSPPPAAPSTAGEGAAPSALDGGNPFRALEDRWAAFVPGMHLVATREGGPENVELVRADQQDLCVRVAFEASEPVIAALVDTRGATLATSAEHTNGILGDQGPVCVRKGDAVHASATGPSTARVLWVAWSPR